MNTLRKAFPWNQRLNLRTLIERHKRHWAARLVIVPVRYFQGLVLPYARRMRGTFLSKWSSRFSSLDNRENAMRISRQWATIFHFKERWYGTLNALSTDCSHHVVEFHLAEPFTGRTVLELGSLEGGNSKQLLQLGAKSVLGIESNPESHLKSLIAKNIFQLDSAQFLFGDLVRVLGEGLSQEDAPQFDVCLASGVLYHLPDPLRAIDLLAGYAPVIKVWTQVASAVSPKGRIVTLVDSENRGYQGRRKHYTLGAHIGGIKKTAVWLYESDLLKAFEDRDYVVSNIAGEDTPSGKAVRFIAKKNGHQWKENQQVDFLTGAFSKLLGD